MDPTLMTLAGKALQLVAPYVARGGAKVADALGEAIGAQLKEVVDRIRARFRLNPENASMLEQYAEDPTSNEPKARAALAREMEADPGFRAEIAAGVKRFGPVLNIVQRIRDGENVTGVEIESVRNGLMQVHQAMDRANGVVGAKINTFGDGE